MLWQQSYRTRVAIIEVARMAGPSWVFADLAFLMTSQIVEGEKEIITYARLQHSRGRGRFSLFRKSGISAVYSRCDRQNWLARMKCASNMASIKGLSVGKGVGERAGEVQVEKIGHDPRQQSRQQGLLYISSNSSWPRISLLPHPLHVLKLPFK
ncbi:Uncharacterized protein TCM_004362 [Theobroma cacao]|uniref:Uncharacterized protein n=1 Tax=Theobroma cacao TaxID=3641 RepID=A0A061DXN0_THECC|nr:Uncharacterized protein TCM_004362 [Theobroma cacao]